MVGNYLYRRIATLDSIQSRRRGPGCEYLVITVNNIHKDPQRLVQLPTKGHPRPSRLVTNIDSTVFHLGQSKCLSVEALPSP